MFVLILVESSFVFAFKLGKHGAPQEAQSDIK